MVDIAVDEGALANLSKMPEEVQGSVERILTVVKQQSSAKHFEPQKVLPDDAPTKVKNEMAAGRGRVFHIGITFNDGSVLFMAWYEPRDRSMIVFYDIRYPVNVIIDDSEV